MALGRSEICSCDGAAGHIQEDAAVGYGDASQGSTSGQLDPVQSKLQLIGVAMGLVMSRGQSGSRRRQFMERDGRLEGRAEALVECNWLALSESTLPMPRIGR